MCGCFGDGSSVNKTGELPTDTSKINTKGWVDSPWISRDGNKMFFMYSQYNFFPIFELIPGSPRLEGPLREGHHAVDPDTGNPFWDSDIYVSEKSESGWSKPVNLGLNDEKGDCCHIFVNSMSRIYYTKENSGTGTDLYYRDLDGSGNPLGALVLIEELVSDTNEDNPHVTESDDAMWFTSSRDGGQGGKDIWFSHKVDGVWQSPVNIGSPINTDKDEDQFWISDNPGLPKRVLFNRGSQIFESFWDGSNFSTPVYVDLGLKYVGEASMPYSEDILYFASSNPDSDVQQIKIYSAVRNSDGTFQKPIPLD
tara:strand:+ start:76705 stop:77634 length:930 start_codon:yes stop_codon:yes gene_type:complete